MLWKEKYLRWIGITLVALLLAAIVKRDSELPFLLDYSISWVITAIYWNVAFMVFMYYRRKYPLIRQTPKRLAFTITILLVFIMGSDILVCHFLNGKDFSQLFEAPLDYLEYSPVTLSVTLIVGSIYENVYFFEQWRNSIRINEALKNQQIRTQFEVLQNQMSPHFLFNSLNALSALISEDTTLAIKFTDKLSDVYRYILQNKEKELVTLEEELVFVKAYVFLQQMRYPENLQVNFTIPSRCTSMHIAPLTLQILIENAIKHNIVSKAYPLCIEVYVENERTIVVKNILQKRNVLEKSTKTGLRNIQKRYHYLGHDDIEIIQTAKNFMVTIPLIRVKEDMLI